MGNRKVARTGARLLSIVAIAAVTMAPASDQPEQISAAQPIWDTPGQTFDLQFEVQRSAIYPGEICPNCEIRAMIVSSIDIYDVGSLVAELGPNLHSIVVRQSDLTTSGRMVPIAPQHVAWDRNDGSIDGDVELVVTAELVWLNYGGSIHLKSSLATTVNVSDEL